MAAAAQSVVDEWSQDEEGWDEEFGAGGACDRVSEALADVVGKSLENVEFIDGGHDGDDHAWLIVYDDEEAYSVDIPPGVYETGGGYRWTKLEDARISPEDVEILKLNRRDVVAVFRRSSDGIGMGSGTLDLSEAAIRVASSSVEAARRSRSRRKKKPAKGGRKTLRETRPDNRAPAPILEADLTAPVTEYSCQIELSVSADFEGQVEKQRLIKKLKAELTASLRAGMGIVARDLGMQSTGVEVRPVRVECAVSDHA